MRLKTMLAVAALCGAATVACAQKERYGTIDASAPAVKVKDVLLSESYGGKDVRLSGTIAMQCASTGCWFFLDDGTGTMLVDLQRLGLGLRARSGRKASVSGTVIVDAEGQVRLDAKGLEVS